MIKNSFSGKFIVIEGLDGSGKSVQAELLAKYLQEKGKVVILKTEPTTESEAGIKIRKILKGEMQAEPMERQKLFVQDRAEHLENKVIPALKEGKFVVCSRYTFSTIAYGHSDDLDVFELVKMNKDFLLPDATIVINVSVKECIKRIEKRGEAKELFEKEKKLIKVNEIYQKLPTMFENVIMIDGEKSIPEVFEEIKKVVGNLL
ncbi:MAG: dTMP kinase [Candidatus Staskawiczbacteria bacterium RIFCSPLOWO2_01_FULL_38_12b]|uniref:Thymidylate kinase n=1 Tax=Candidatus Staskawiczbacteria bacterium RIFCSPLOWO2_01_FULL_38_12b TaxID=1802214 RepID=A0A1G2IF95_9BACT|nr:MAG: dTMP kinase [Candidatus Staskawiczbacteria bacterium RIFCSPLOWO2_01_FULL_38_12b]